jgi:hypothetical protein
LFVGVGAAVLALAALTVMLVEGALLGLAMPGRSALGRLAALSSLLAAAGIAVVLAIAATSQTGAFGVAVTATRGTPPGSGRVRRGHAQAGSRRQVHRQRPAG